MGFLEERRENISRKKTTGRRAANGRISRKEATGRRAANRRKEKVYYSFMPSSVTRFSARYARNFLRTIGTQHEWMQRVLSVGKRECATALEEIERRRAVLAAATRAEDGMDPSSDSYYGAEYYGVGRVPTGAGTISGYDSYDRVSSNADLSAYLVWRFFSPVKSLDIGCALGFVVEALRDLGVDAYGCDISEYAVAHSPENIRDRIQQADLSAGLPYQEKEFPLITIFECLEHLPPEVIPAALQELCRVSSGYVICTIPSFGMNKHGPSGWFDGKVLESRLAYYRMLGPSYTGPIPYADLQKDARGRPIEGHLCIASFSWWTQQFEKAGFIRAGAMEKQMCPAVARVGKSKLWNFYVFHPADLPFFLPVIQEEEEIARVEAQWEIGKHGPVADDLAAVDALLGKNGLLHSSFF